MNILQLAALAAKMGEALTDDQRKANEWKARMLKSIPGLSLPDDWDSLSEDEKQRRLDIALGVAGKGGRHG